MMTDNIHLKSLIVSSRGETSGVISTNDNATTSEGMAIKLEKNDPADKLSTFFFAVR